MSTKRGWTKDKTYSEFVASNEKFPCSTPRCPNTRARDQVRCASCVVAHRHYGSATATRISTADLKPWLPIAASFVERQVRHSHAGTLAVLELAEEMIARGARADAFVREHDAPFTSRLEQALAWLASNNVTPRKVVEHIVAVCFLVADRSPEWNQEALARVLGRFVLRAGGSMGDRNRATKFHRALGVHLLGLIRPYVASIIMYARDSVKAREGLRQRLTSMPIPSDDPNTL